MQSGLNRRLFLQGLALSCTLAPWLGVGGEGEYRPVRWWGHLDGQGEKIFRVIREFSLKGQKLVWLVDEETLLSSIHDRSQVRRLEEISGSDSRYTRCIQLASSPPYPLENSGIRRANHEVNGIFLTIDLCPSPQGMEYRLFEALLKSDLPRPIPLSLAISGGWLRHHRADAKWLLERERDGAFDLLWINHSYNHFYDR
ncbi:MAG: hypothetical protein HQL55_07585, partial [Magnetococcales bacterium]|nr:hypothetical protein [Magnetococcales bacterium]